MYDTVTIHCGRREVASGVAVLECRRRGNWDSGVGPNPITTMHQVFFEFRLLKRHLLGEKNYLN